MKRIKYVIITLLTFTLFMGVLSAATALSNKVDLTYKKADVSDLTLQAKLEQGGKASLILTTDVNSSEVVYDGTKAVSLSVKHKINGTENTFGYSITKEAAEKIYKSMNTINTSNFTFTIPAAANLYVACASGSNACMIGLEEQGQASNTIEMSERLGADSSYKMVAYYRVNGSNHFTTLRITNSGRSIENILTSGKDSIFNFSSKRITIDKKIVDLIMGIANKATTGDAAFNISTIDNYNISCSGSDCSAEYQDLVVDRDKTDDNYSDSDFANGNFCENPNIIKVWTLAGYVIFMIKVVVPVLLIVMAMIDFTKELMNDKNKDTGPIVKKISSKVIAAILVFLVIQVVSMITNIFANGTDWKGCAKCAFHPFNDGCEIITVKQESTR